MINKIFDNEIEEISIVTELELIPDLEINEILKQINQNYEDKKKIKKGIINGQTIETSNRWR